MKSLCYFAFNVTDPDQARQFYGQVSGCDEGQRGRTTATWVDFDFFSRQISLHLGEPFKLLDTLHKTADAPTPTP